MAERNKRGFAAMDREKQRAIASKGGHASHVKGTAHEFTIDEARLAGRKGGEVISGNRQHMSEIGRKGGAASGRGRARTHQEPAMATSEDMRPAGVQPQQRPGEHDQEQRSPEGSEDSTGGQGGE